jgi:hypothetical protein
MRPHLAGGRRAALRVGLVERDRMPARANTIAQAVPMLPPPTTAIFGCGAAASGPCVMTGSS